MAENAEILRRELRQESTSLIASCATPQMELDAVFRWGSIGEVRKQTVAAHTIGMIELVLYGCTLINSQRDIESWLDEQFLMTLALAHDKGEGVLGRDKWTTIKTARDDYNEYLAFVNAYTGIHPLFFKRLHRAFLLQFCFKDKFKTYLNGANHNALQILAELEETMRDEAYFFMGLEKLEFVLFGLEQMFFRDNIQIAVSTIDHHMKKLRKACKEVPEFRMLWTEKLEMLCLELSAAYPNLERI